MLYFLKLAWRPLATASVAVVRELRAIQTFSSFVPRTAFIGPLEDQNAYSVWISTEQRYYRQSDIGMLQWKVHINQQINSSWATEVLNPCVISKERELMCVPVEDTQSVENLCCEFYRINVCVSPKTNMEDYIFSKRLGLYFSCNTKYKM